MYIKYGEHVYNFFENYAYIIEDVKERYYFFPFAMRKVSDGVFEEISLYDLPKEIRAQIDRIHLQEPTQNP